MLSPDELLEKVRDEQDESVLVALVRKGGRKVSIENGDERVKACAGCDYIGKVVGGLTGCKICKCPLASKAYMKDLLGTKATCPHPDGSRWEQIDKNY